MNRLDRKIPELAYQNMQLSGVVETVLYLWFAMTKSKI